MDHDISSVEDAVLIKVQTANTASGKYDVHQSLPYPYFADALTGSVTRHPETKAILGFQRTRHIQRVDLIWGEAAKDPDAMLGMYPVITDGKGGIYSVTLPVTEAKVVQP